MNTVDGGVQPLEILQFGIQILPVNDMGAHPWAPGPGRPPLAMSNEPWTINNQLIHGLMIN